jgi:hypothetical protein
VVDTICSCCVSVQAFLPVLIAGEYGALRIEFEEGQFIVFRDFAPNASALDSALGLIEHVSSEKEQVS